MTTTGSPMKKSQSEWTLAVTETITVKLVQIEKGNGKHTFDKSFDECYLIDKN